MIFGNMGDMVKKAREMQENLKKIKDELQHLTYEGEAQGVKVVVNGDMEVKEIKIDPKVNLMYIPNLTKDAANKALNSAKKDAADKLKSAAGGLSLPGIV